MKTTKHIEKVRISMSCPIRNESRRQETIAHISMSADVSKGSSIIQAKLELEQELCEASKVSMHRIADALKTIEQCGENIEECKAFLAEVGYVEGA